MSSDPSLLYLCRKPFKAIHFDRPEVAFKCGTLVVLVVANNNTRVLKLLLFGLLVHDPQRSTQNISFLVSFTFKAIQPLTKRDDRVYIVRVEGFQTSDEVGLSSRV